MTGIFGQDWSSYSAPRPGTAGLAFMFTKVTEGTSYVNPEWPGQYADALAGALVPGKYHYPHMGDGVQAEADYFLSQAAVVPGVDLVALDWEGYDSANAGVPATEQRAYKDAWLKYVKAKLPHNPVGMYCNKDYWLNIDTTSYYQDFLWIATDGLPAGQPGIQAPWLFHQYGSSGTDQDYCHLPSKAALAAWTASFAAPPPLPLPAPPAPATPESDMPSGIQIQPKSASASQLDTLITFPRGSARTVAFYCDNARVDAPAATLRVTITSDDGPQVYNGVAVSNAKGSTQTVLTFASPAITHSVQVIREDDGPFTVGMEVS